MRLLTDNWLLCIQRKMCIPPPAIPFRLTPCKIQRSCDAQSFKLYCGHSHRAEFCHLSEFLVHKTWTDVFWGLLPQYFVYLRFLVVQTKSFVLCLGLKWSYQKKSTSNFFSWLMNCSILIKAACLFCVCGFFSGVHGRTGSHSGSWSAPITCSHRKQMKKARWKFTCMCRRIWAFASCVNRTKSAKDREGFYFVGPQIYS